MNLLKVASKPIRHAILLALLLTQTAYAADHWLCTSEASQIQNQSLLACGVGQGKDENEARTTAFENAKAEFKRVCAASDTCRGHEISVEPKRTTCEGGSVLYKCYRLIVFSIGEKLRSEISVKPSSAPGDSALDPDQKEVFKAFHYESIAKLPKVFKGMSKKDLLASFGAPGRVSEIRSYDGGSSELLMYYKGKMCLYSSCMVVVRDGKVVSFDDFNAVYTDWLK